jgi:Transposase DDE domain
VAAGAGAGIVSQSSLKAALDRDWDDPTARDAALAVVLVAPDAVEQWLAPSTAADALPAAAQVALAAARPVRAQDVVADAAGGRRLRQGVAPDRRIAIEDPAMRPGRKRRSERVNRYKRHGLRDLESGLIRAGGIPAANVPEAEGTDAITADLAAQQAAVGELHIDRAYLSSRWVRVRDRPATLAVYGKAWPVQAGARFAKSAVCLDWEAGTIPCPGGVGMPFTLGSTVPFPRQTCGRCALRSQCTTSVSGRTVTIHPDERLLEALRTRQQTAAGRAKLRERVAVEHSLAHIGHWQGDRARYLGERKHLFDLRRVAAVHNLHVWARFEAVTDSEAA